MSETPTKKKKRILSPVKQKYKKDYTDTWPCFTKSKLSEHHVYCQTCRADIKIAHGGKIDCRKHVETDKHPQASKQVESSAKILAVFARDTELYVISLDLGLKLCLHIF